MNLKSLLGKIALLLCFFPAISNSALLLDPYVGMNVGGTTKFTSGSSAVDYDYNNAPVSLGGRIGFSKLLFSAGLDYQLTSDIKLKNQTEKYDSSELAIFAGFDLPILLRAYAGFIFSADFESTSNKYDEGSGYKIGVGFTGLPFISINLEYKSVSYDKLNNATVATADHNATLLAVSLPLKLF